jgi:hypothetical protein
VSSFTSARPFLARIPPKFDVSGRLVDIVLVADSCTEMLSSASVLEVLPEIIWNFCHYEGGKNVSLVQNPHLYTELPTLPEAYQPTFNHLQVQTLTKDRDNRYRCDLGDNQDNRDPQITVHLLTNNSRRVFFVGEFGKKEKPQAFDKVWTTDNTLLFKG